MLEPREAAKIVLADTFTVAGALAVIDQPALSNAIAVLTASFETPLIRAEPRFDGPLSQEVRTWLKPIGMKAFPRLSSEAKTEWLTAMTMALSDLPASVVARAVRKAIHVPVKFENEVEFIVRDIAKEMVNQQRNAIHRLKLMRAEIERAAAPQPALEHQPMIWTQESVDAANRTFAKIGAETRYEYDGEGGVTSNVQTKTLDGEAERADTSASTDGKATP